MEYQSLSRVCPQAQCNVFQFWACGEILGPSAGSLWLMAFLSGM